MSSGSRYARETAWTWSEAEARLYVLRLAGYQAQAVDMGDTIVIHVTPGKHKHVDLSALPASTPRGA